MATRSPLKLTTDPKPRGPLKVAFGVRALEAIKAPASGRTWVYDDPSKPRGVSGLAMVTTANGAKSLYHVRTHKGQKSRIFIAKLGEVSIEQARQIAEQANADYAAGKNPAAARKTADAAMNFGALFSLFIERHAKKHKRTWSEDQAQFDRHLKQWEKRRLADITRVDVAAIHTRIGKEAPVAANRVLALLSSVFTFAAGIGFEGKNPAKGVKRFAEKTRERFLDASELPRFLKAIADEPNRTMADFVMVSLLTGQRRENVAAMAWEHIDFKRQCWTIPAAQFKTGNEVTVPLVPRVIDLLNDRLASIDAKAKDPRDAHVFPNRSSNSARLYIAEPKGVMKRLCKAAGIKPTRLHDLRRTLASWATMQGTPYPVVASMIGHKAHGVTSIYARFDMEAVRKAFEQTADAMLNAPMPAEKQDDTKGGEA